MTTVISSTTITVLSACYGGYDTPVAPPEQDIPVRWVMVTDGTVDVPEPWETVVDTRTHLHPRMAAKIPKCLPWYYSHRAPITIWLDASARIQRPDFVSMCVDALGDGDVAQWVHPERSCIEPEAFISAGMEKYADQPVMEQAAKYLKDGQPRNYGLWATGCMAWRFTASTVQGGRMWLAEQTLWTYQDQLSWPVIVRMYDLDVRPLPGGLWDRQYLTFRPHASNR